jgi:hypothetical protein
LTAKPPASLRKTVSALLSLAKSAIAEGRAGIPSCGEVPIAYEGRTFFWVTDRALRCAKCGRQLVPRKAEDMSVWSWGKSQFIRDHVRCFLP